MDAKIKDEWIAMISDEELNIEAEWIYILMNPDDKKEFFRLVNVIITRHNPSKDEDKDEERFNQVWTKAYKTKFKLTAVNYLIEFEKDREHLVQPGTIPIDPIIAPINIPYYPPVTTDPYPWQLPQVYCITSTK